MKSTEIVLSKEEIAALEAAVPVAEVEGERYSDNMKVFEEDKNRALTAEEANKHGLAVE